MKGATRSQTTVVADGHVFMIAPDYSEAPRRMTVTVRDDSDHEWTFEEPGWMPLSYGVSNGRFQMWSARRLMIFGPDAVEPEIITSDEDIHYVFGLEEGWVLITETSVSFFRGGAQRSRLELPDVVLAVKLDGRRLSVTMFDGTALHVMVTADGLSIA